LLGLIFHPEVGGSTFVGSVGEILPRLHGVISQKAIIFIVTAVITARAVS
jgi:hypothetical protein